MRSKRGTDRFVGAFHLTALLSVASSLLRAVIFTVVLMQLTTTDGSAATVERFSLHRIDNVAEVEFQMRGTVPRWHLHTHGQELWVDLERTQVSTSVEAVSVPVSFPLTRVSVRDFGDGWVRVIIRVRGEVDYAAAQTPRVLVVRIAPSGQAVDLAQPLLRQIERNGRRSVSLEAPNHILESPAQGSATANEGRQIPSEAAQTADLSAAADSAISGSQGGVSPNIVPGPPLVRREPSYGAQEPSQTVQPVAQRIGPPPWARPDRGPPMVAIDAGHGGFDPGTESASGITEKTVALAIARRLAAALESRGIAAELTRNDDRFLGLGERTALANHAHADLFVSIHLNSSPDWNTSGIETYYLNNTTDRATIRLARIENGGDYGAPGQSNLNYILANLQQDYKAHEASSVARMIETEVATSVDTEMGIRVNPLGAKMGPFYVLVGAEMPSVLVECGFLSNPREAAFLIQPTYQDALAEGIAAAIAHYFNADAAVGNL